MWWTVVHQNWQITGMHNSKVEQLGLADLGNVLKALDGKAYVQVWSHHRIGKSHPITHTLNEMYSFVGWRQQPWHLPWLDRDVWGSSSIPKYFLAFTKNLEKSKVVNIQEDLVLTLRCDGESQLYPPKGKPFGCLPDRVISLFIPDIYHGP